VQTEEEERACSREPGVVRLGGKEGGRKAAPGGRGRGSYTLLGRRRARARALPDAGVAVSRCALAVCFFTAGPLHPIPVKRKSRSKAGDADTTARISTKIGISVL